MDAFLFILTVLGAILALFWILAIVWWVYAAVQFKKAATFTSAVAKRRAASKDPLSGWRL